MKNKRTHGESGQSTSIFVMVIIATVTLALFLYAQRVEGAESSCLNHMKAILHHTVSPDWGVERIRKIHVEENGWDDIGYHFVIRKDGTIEAGRPLWKKGAHAKGRNDCIGIALTGYDTFTPEQLEAVRRLCKDLAIRELERHHEECPGKGITDEFLKQAVKG